MNNKPKRTRRPRRVVVATGNGARLSRECRECDGFPFHESWCKKISE